MWVLYFTSSQRHAIQSMRFLSRHKEVGRRATLSHLRMIQTIPSGHVAAPIHCPVISPTYPMCLGKN